MSMSKGKDAASSSKGAGKAGEEIVGTDGVRNKFCKGINVKTQLQKDDPDIAKPEEVKAAPVKMMTMQDAPYTEAQTNAAFFAAANDVTKKKDPNIAVLDQTGRVFLDPKYKPQLMAGQAGTMGGTQTAQTVDLKAYRADLVKLRDQYDKQGKKQQKEAVDTLLAAVDKNQLLTLAQVQQVYEVLGNDAEIPKEQAYQILDNMVKQGQLTKEEADEIKKKMQGDKVKVNDMAKMAQPGMGVKPDGTVASKKAMSGPSPKSSAAGGGGPTPAGAYKVQKGMPQSKVPFSGRYLGGQACGPSKAPQQHYIMDRRETGVSADL